MGWIWFRPVFNGISQTYRNISFRRSTQTESHSEPLINYISRYIQTCDKSCDQNTLSSRNKKFLLRLMLFAHRSLMTYRNMGISYLLTTVTMVDKVEPLPYRYLFLLSQL